MATKKLKSRSAVKPTVKKRTLNWTGAAISRGAPASEQDPKRRLGDFTGAGEHSRLGGRTSGIVGQTTKKVHTDKRKK
jgi:hypothetical protein